MTLNDLEWPFYDFTLNFHYCEQRFQTLFYMLAVEPVYRIFLLYYLTNRDMRKQNIWDLQKDCRSFVDEKLLVLRRRNLNK